jgi:hypothetical protein
MKHGYNCLIFQPIDAKAIGKNNWTNFECHVEVWTNKECKNNTSRMMVFHLECQRFILKLNNVI